MTVRVSDAARHLSELSGWTLSNLQLQKMLYLADMMYVGENGERLVDENFEAWDYGPVLPSLYHTCKAFGSKPIPNIFRGARPISGTSEATMLEDAWKNLKDFTPGELVSNTHWLGGAWHQRYVPGSRGISIRTEDMIAEYQARQAD